MPLYTHIHTYTHPLPIARLTFLKNGDLYSSNHGTCSSLSSPQLPLIYSCMHLYLHQENHNQLNNLDCKWICKSLNYLKYYNSQNNRTENYVYNRFYPFEWKLTPYCYFELSIYHFLCCNTMGNLYFSFSLRFSVVG